MTLRKRSRWGRIWITPRVYRQYRQAGLPWTIALRFVWMLVKA